MATVPSWIAKGYAYIPATADAVAHVIPVTHWRATPTQVVVELAGRVGEYRFRLGDLQYAYRRDFYRNHMILIAPDDDRVRTAPGTRILRAAVNDLLKVIGSTHLDPSSMDAEALLTAIGRIQRAATKAMADLAEVL